MKKRKLAAGIAAAALVAVLSVSAVYAGNQGKSVLALWGEILKQSADEEKINTQSADDEPLYAHQAELAVAVQGVDIVVLKQHPHIVLQQFLSILDAVQGGTGKAGYFLCNDEVEPPCLGVGNHPKETIPLSGACSADALVNIARNIGPVWLGLNQLCIVLYLIFQAVQLLVFVCGHSGVKGYP